MHRLKSSFKCGVLFDILSVFVKCSCPDASQLSSVPIINMLNELHFDSVSSTHSNDAYLASMGFKRFAASCREDERQKGEDSKQNVDRQNTERTRVTLMASSSYHGAIHFPCSQYKMDLVYEQNDAPHGFLHFVEHLAGTR